MSEEKLKELEEMVISDNKRIAILVSMVGHLVRLLNDSGNLAQGPIDVQDLAKQLIALAPPLQQEQEKPTAQQQQTVLP